MGIGLKVEEIMSILKDTSFSENDKKILARLIVENNKEAEQDALNKDLSQWETQYVTKSKG